MGCSARLKTSFELNPVTEGTFPLFVLYLNLNEQLYPISTFKEASFFKCDVKPAEYFSLSKTDKHNL